MIRVPAAAALALLTVPALAADMPAPGDTVHLTFQDLPEPYATPSAHNPPRRTGRPDDARLEVPPGYRAELIATGFSRPRQMVVHPGGEILVADSGTGEIIRLKDGRRSVFADGFARPYGLVLRDDHVFVADVEAVWRLPMAGGPRQQVTPDGALGAAAGHWTRNIAFSPDGRTLFVAIGSWGNIDHEAPPRATVQAFDYDPVSATATNQRTFASGLRNPVGLAVHPDTGALYTVVNERDGMGDGLVPDYLTRLEAGQFYGWPDAWLGPHPQPKFPADPDMVARTVAPDVLFKAHSAPLGLTFWDGDALVAFHGSWNRSSPTGYLVARVPFENDRPVGHYEIFATGFRLNGGDRATVWGRPTGVTVTPDDALLVSEDAAGTIWKITREP